MKKKYVSRLSRVGIYVLVDGVSVPVDLTPGFIDGKGNRGSVFETEDEKLQAAIESHPSFGKTWMNDIYLSDETPSEEPKTPTATKKPRKQRESK